MRKSTTSASVISVELRDYYTKKSQLWRIEFFYEISTSASNSHGVGPPRLPSLTIPILITRVQQKRYWHLSNTRAWGIEKLKEGAHRTQKNSKQCVHQILVFLSDF